MNSQINFLKLSLMFWVILVNSFYCTGESEDRADNENRQLNLDPASRSISPQKEYTKDKPAEWAQIANDHLPEIVFEKSKSKDNVKVKVLGRKFSERHYIEIIGLMDEHKADIDIKHFERGNNPIAILTLNQKEHNPETVKVFAKCNLHDLWTVPLISKEE
ncbi:MAG: hypothetical protein KBF99_02305 [Leptospiraceae bacterium]|nr:hypothetical protein [Leptospiraceae bacterium]MBP9161979.1 hypothetical protein [Leptospiraceae bacterium]